MTRRSDREKAREAHARTLSNPLAGGVQIRKAGPTPPQSPMGALAQAMQGLMEKQNILAQQLHILAAQQKMLVNILQKKLSVTDDEFGTEFMTVCKELGINIVSRPSAEEGDTSDATSESPAPDSGSGADNALSDLQQATGATEGETADHSPPPGGVSELQRVQ